MERPESSRIWHSLMKCRERYELFPAAAIIFRSRCPGVGGDRSYKEHKQKADAIHYLRESHAERYKAARRDLLKAMAAWNAAATLAGCLSNLWLRRFAQSGFPGSAAQSRSDLRPWARYPDKTDLLMLTDRPPLVETPLHHFLSDLTPNDAYFVRWPYAGVTHQHRPAYISALGRREL